jgi:hypothetical protein
MLQPEDETTQRSNVNQSTPQFAVKLICSIVFGAAAVLFALGALFNPNHRNDLYVPLLLGGLGLCSIASLRFRSGWVIPCIMLGIELSWLLIFPLLNIATAGTVSYRERVVMVVTIGLVSGAFAGFVVDESRL